MNLLHLKYVVEVAKTHSITKAAQNLFMGQPNLSKAIKELEKDIGISIFKRTAKGVEPTVQGKSFLSHAQSILSEIDTLEMLYKKTDDSIVHFNISVPRSTYASVVFANFANRFVDKKEVSLQFKETSPMEAIEDVINNVSSLAVVRFQDICENYFYKLLNANNLKYEPLWAYKMQILMHKDHPLASLPIIPCHMLDDFIEIIHGGYDIPAMQLSEETEKSNISSKQVIVYDRGSQYTMLSNLKGSYLWSSQLPKNILEKNGFVVKPTTPVSVTNKDIIVYTKTANLSPIAHDFIKELKEQVAVLDTNSISI